MTGHHDSLKKPSGVSVIELDKGTREVRWADGTTEICYELPGMVIGWNPDFRPEAGDNAPTILTVRTGHHGDSEALSAVVVANGYVVQYEPGLQGKEPAPVNPLAYGVISYEGQSANGRTPKSVMGEGLAIGGSLQLPFPGHKDVGEIISVRVLTRLGDREGSAPSQYDTTGSDQWRRVLLDTQRVATGELDVINMDASVSRAPVSHRIIASGMAGVAVGGSNRPMSIIGRVTRDPDMRSAGGFKDEV